MNQEGSTEWRKTEIKALCNKVIVACSKMLALLVFIGMHRFLEYLLGLAFSAENHRLEVLMGGGTTLGFGFVYLCQIWDMIILFVPRFSFPGKSKEEGVPIVNGAE